VILYSVQFYALHWTDNNNTYKFQSNICIAVSAAVLIAAIRKRSIQVDDSVIVTYTKLSDQHAVSCTDYKRSWQQNCRQQLHTSDRVNTGAQNFILLPLFPTMGVFISPKCCIIERKFHHNKTDCEI